MSADVSMDDLTDEQWARLAPATPVPPRRPDGRERLRVAYRAILNGMVWVFARGRGGKTYPRRIRCTRPAIAGSKHGLSRGCI